MPVVSKLRSLRRVAGITALVYSVYALLVVYLVPPIARHLTETRLGALLHRPVTVKGIYLNPFTLCLKVRGLEIWEPDGETLFAGVQRVDVNLDLVLSALQRGLVVSAVTVDGPHAVVVRRPDASFNFSDLVKAPATAAPAPAPAADSTPSSRPPRFSVANIQINDGWFFFRDEVVNARQRLTGVHLAVPAVSSLPTRVEVYVRPAFHAWFDGQAIAVDSQTKPFAASQESSADIRLHNLDLTAFTPYMPEPRNFDLSSGWLDLDLAFRYLQTPNRKPSVSVSGDIGLRDVRVTGRDGHPMAGVAALQLSLLPTDLMQKEVHLSRVLCRAPFYRLSRDARGTLLLPRVGAEDAAATAPSASPGTPAPAATPTGPPAPPPVTADIDEIRVEQGRLEFDDAAVSPAFQTALDFHAEVKGLTTRPERPMQISFETATESAETVAGIYAITLFPQLTVTGTTTVTDVRLPKYMPYLNKTLACAIDRGTLCVKVDHALALPVGASAEVKISDLDLGVSDFCLTAGADHAPVVTFQELTVTDLMADLDARDVVVGAFATHGGQVQVQRFKDGSLNLQKLVQAGPAPAPGAAPTTAAAPAPAATPWTITVRDAAVAQWAVALEDQQPGTPVHLAVSDITVNIKDLTTRADQHGTLALGLRLNDSAALAVTGGFSVQPLAVDLNVKLTDLALKDFHGYVADHLKLLISDGAVETELKVVVSQAADAAFTGTVDGAFVLRRFASVDQVHSEDFVKCRELALRGIHVDLKPLAVRLEEVALSGLDTAITVKPDGSVNLLSVLGVASAPAADATHPATPPPPAPASTSGGGSAFPLDIAMIRVDGCGVIFTDEGVTPHYCFTLGELAGTVTALSLSKPTPAEINLSARFDGHAPFSFHATAANLGPQMTLTAATVLKDFDLSPATPYSGRYVGYAVQRGKLNFDLQYSLDKRRLVAEHKVLIDHFAFGQKIDSPDATKLPVRLAVALLKDRKGQISLDVPVRGSLDDPEFSVLRLVLKVLRDLVAKAATAPFAMLGALVGGGEELSFVEFGAGSSDLDGAAAKKLELLAKALVERPELQVETGGTVDPVSDREALVRQAVLRQIKARRLADLVKAGKPAVSVDEVSLSAAERDHCLLAIYRETLAPPPPAKRSKTLPKEPTPAEIEQQLIARTTVTDTEVNLLAGQRAARVHEFLTTTGKIEPERVFVVDTAPPAAGGAPAAPVRQVRLSLR